MSTLKVNELQLASGSKLTLPANTVESNMGSSFGFRNKIINGDMRIDQRNAGASTSLNASAPYTLDRWKAQNSANAGTVQRVASTISGYPYSLKYTSTGSSTWFQLGQQIEYLNFANLVGKSVTISFTAKANNTNVGSTALVLRTRESASVDTSVIFSAAATDTSINISTTSARYSISRTIGATSGSLSVEFSLGSHVSGDGFDVTGVQLEEGSVATPFEHRPYGMELALCQRYYEKGGYRFRGYDNSSTIANVFYFKQTKRVPPTMTGGSIVANYDYGFEVQLMAAGNVDTGYQTFTANAEL